MSHSKSSVAHRDRWIAAAVPLALAIACAGTAAAQPAQPGTTAQPGATGTPNPPAALSQPGTTTGPISPELSTAPAGTQSLPDEVAPVTDYAPERAVPVYHHIAPLRVNRIHAPQPVPAVAPIVAPKNTVRVGNIIEAAPAWLPKPAVGQINTAAADTEAQISHYARSIGVAPSRADRIASAVVSDTVVGGFVGAAASVIPDLVIAGLVATPFEIVGAALVGGAVGAIVGATQTQ